LGFFIKGFETCRGVISQNSVEIAQILKENEILQAKSPGPIQDGNTGWICVKRIKVMDMDRLEWVEEMDMV
jgi:hypothetical protein